MVYESYSPDDTYRLGIETGSKAEPGQIYCLSGDLGVGKTLFSKGFAKGLLVKEPVTSPTFTIIQTYEDGRIPLYHFDVYRIADIEEMYELGYEEYFFGKGTVLIEWAELINDILPENRINIKITKELSKGIDYRLISIKDYAVYRKELK